MSAAVKIKNHIHTITDEDAAKWLDSPASLIMTGQAPVKLDSKDIRRHYRKQEGFELRYVAPDVFKMGKLPFPHMRTIQTWETRAAQKMAPAYDPMDHWMGASHILCYMTPTELIQRGHINLDTASKSTVSNEFKINTAAVTAMKAAYVANANGSAPLPSAAHLVDNSGIHPIFREQNWRGTTDIRYEYLKPTLRIASKMLEMEAVLDFFYALGSPWAKHPTTAFAKSHHPTIPWHWSFSPIPLSDQQRRDVAAELVKMQDHLYFEWVREPLVDDASTNEGVRMDANGNPTTTPGLRNHANSVGVRISLNTKWKEYLMDNQTLASSILPGADDESCLMRTQFNLAITILHELAHGWRFNTGPPEVPYQVEPYCNDDRVSEVGYALENAIAGSLIGPIGGNPHLTYAPFGFFTRRYPGDRIPSDYEIEPYLATPSRYGINHYTEYGVPMDYVLQFFTDDFWQNRVQRFGTGALLPPKPFGVRKRLHNEHDFHVLEVQHVKRRRVGNAWVDDPEQSSPTGDTLLPNVKEGILFPDKGYDFTGRQLDANTGKVDTTATQNLFGNVPSTPSKTKEKIARLTGKIFGKLTL